MRINVNQFSLNTKIEDLIFDIRRGKGHLFRYFLNRFKWHYYPRFHIVDKFPDHVDIEITNNCNMKCPMCYRPLMKVPFGFMDFELFKKIVNECAENGVYSIRLSLRGETLLHPRVIEMVKYSKQKKIKEVSFLTNALLLNEKMSADLIDAGLDWITISFDGLGKTYEEIRYPAKYEEAIERIKILQRIKKEKGKIKPVVKVQTIWPAIEKNPEEYYVVFTSIADKISSNPLIVFGNNEPGQKQYIPDFTCPVPWQRLVITWTGKVLQCVNDVYEKNIIGDINHQNIKEVWHGAKMRHVRESHLKHLGAKVLKPCKDCYSVFETRKTEVSVGKRKVTTEMHVNK